MKRGDLNGRTLLVTGIFMASIFIVALKIVTPTEIHIYLEGEEAVLSQMMRTYTFNDVALVITSVFIAGLCTMYLVLHDRGKVIGDFYFKQKRQDYEKILPTLKMDEQKVFKAVLDSDGIIAQSEIVKMTGISRSGVSRALDRLESRGYVERRRRGMSNVIVLK